MCRLAENLDALIAERYGEFREADGFDDPPETTASHPSIDAAFAPITRALVGGEEFDLGDRAIRVLHTPGHSRRAPCARGTRRNSALLIADAALGETVPTAGRRAGVSADLSRHRPLPGEHRRRSEASAPPFSSPPTIRCMKAEAGRQPFLTSPRPTPTGSIRQSSRRFSAGRQPRSPASSSSAELPARSAPGRLPPPSTSSSR